MAKKKTAYLCDSCGADFPIWSGQCGACNEWNTLKPFSGISRPITPDFSGKKGGYQAPLPIPIDQVSLENLERRKTGFPGFDHFFGGGLVPGGVTLFGGEPGVGKSTLILQLAKCWADLNGPVLYVSGEEAASQIRLRGDRLGSQSPHLHLLITQDLNEVLHHIHQKKYTLLIIDSIQTLFSPDLEGGPGSIVQLKGVMNQLIQGCKALSLPCFIIGHITKSGDIAGPKLLEHLVDSVLYLEKDENEFLRILRAFKNRYGPVEESLILNLTSTGMKQVKNPGAIYLTHEGSLQPGMAVGAFLIGVRPVLCEIQALVKKTLSPSPRRISVGQEIPRLQVILAVAEKHGGIPLFDTDVFTSVVGGMKMNDPGLDLPLLAALFSALCEKPLPRGSFYCGEVGLVGEIRKCRLMEKRILEAKNLGFKNFFSPMKLDVEGHQQVTDIREIYKKIQSGK